MNLENLERMMEEMANQPRDGGIPIRKPGERNKYEECHTPSDLPTKTHHEPS